MIMKKILVAFRNDLQEALDCKRYSTTNSKTLPRLKNSSLQQMQVGNGLNCGIGRFSLTNSNCEEMSLDSTTKIVHMQTE